MKISSVAVPLSLPLSLLMLPLVCSSTLPGNAQQRSPEYAAVQSRLARGWNTWDTHSVTTHVLLPEGLAIRIGIKDQGTEGSDSFLGNTLIGRQGKAEERVIPGPHTWDGSYTDLTLIWRGRTIQVQSAHNGDDLVLLVSPLANAPDHHRPAAAVFSVGMLWNQPGAIQKTDGRIQAALPSRTIPIFLAGSDTEDPNVPVTGAYFSSELTAPIGLSTGKPRTVEAIQAALTRASHPPKASSSNGDPAQVAQAIETVLGWDTIYEPAGKRVISPVSRIWSVAWGGYVLFDWDNYFAATLAATGDRDLAYANAIEIGREATPQGFIPNYARSGGWKSSDRSEPPVGAITVLGLYQKFGDKWLLQETFPALLAWNRWWAAHRDRDGYLVWGSDRQNQPANLDDSSVGTREGAILESGLDNSPMYDQAGWDHDRHQLLMADVGLMSMVIADSDALAKIADTLGKPAEAAELRQRAAKYSTSLGTLWDPSTGIFRNRDLTTGKLSEHLSPTNFYPLLAGTATPDQARRMVAEHLMNPVEFWGPWVIPSIARNDPAFKDQDYWRGRIWGPMNYLVWLGMDKYQIPGVSAERRQLAQKCLALILKERHANGHVHENYNGTTGEGDDVTSSDRFYHWGALLGLIGLQEEINTAAAR